VAILQHFVPACGIEDELIREDLAVIVEAMGPKRWRAARCRRSAGQPPTWNLLFRRNKSLRYGWRSTGGRAGIVFYGGDIRDKVQVDEKDRSQASVRACHDPIEFLACQQMVYLITGVEVEPALGLPQRGASAARSPPMASVPVPFDRSHSGHNRVLAQYI